MGPPLYENRGPAHVQEVIWKTPEKNTRLAALMTGQSQMRSTSPIPAAPSANPATKLVSSKVPSGPTLGFKIDKPEVNDETLRRGS
jgi:peptide/nickel transport system substrate-binding protein